MSGLSILRIEDEFGKYAGTAVVDDLKLMLKTMYAVGHVSKYPKPECRVVRVWTDYDEVGAEMLAEGFIEGFGHHKEDEPAEDMSLLTDVQSGSFIFGAEKEPAADMQSLADSMNETETDVPPWEQGFVWDGGKNGWSRHNAAGRDVEFIPYTDKLMLDFNEWQDKQDRPGTNTR